MKRTAEVLPISPAPIRGESLPGFVLRLAGLYGRTKIDSLGVAISMPGCAFRPDDIRRLASRCGETIGNLSQLSYILAPNGLRHRFGVIEVPRSALRLWPGRRFCPQCLAESPYHRAIWDLGLISGCLIHHVTLEEHCPDCARRPTWERGPIDRCKCGANLTKTQTSPISHEAVSSTIDLTALISGTVPTAMQHLDLGAADTLHLAISMGLVFERRWKGSRTIRNLLQHDAALVDTVMTTGMDAVRRWPASMAMLVAECRSEANLRPRIYGIAKQLGDSLVGWLHDLPELPFTALIRQTIYNCFDGNPAAQLELQRSALLRPPSGFPAGALISKRDGASALGCSFETIHRLCQIGLIASGPSQGRGVTIAVDRHQIAEHMRARTHGLNLRDAAARLGITRARMRALLNAGLVRELTGASCNRVSYSLNPASLHELVATLEERIEKPPRHECGITLLRATEILKQAGIGFAQFIQEAKVGALRPIRLDASERGLKALRFSRGEILHFAHASRDAAPAIPINSVARKLGIKWEVIDHLIDRELMALEGIGPRRSRMVTQASVDHFANHYRTGSTLAKWMHTSPRNAAALLAAHGISPVAGPMQDGCRQNIYAVADLARAFPLSFPTDP